MDQQARSAAKEAFSHLRPNTAQEVWLSALASENGLIQAPPEGLPALAESLQGWEERHRAACREGLRAALRLSAPSNSNGKWTLDYLLQPTADLSLLIRANNLWSDPKTRKKLSAFSTVDPEDFLLTALSLAGRLFPPIEQSLKKAKPSQASLDTSQAYFFLKEVAPALGIAGFGLLLPSWWRAKTSPRLGLKVKIRPKDRGAGLADNLSLDWEMALGDKTLSPGELESLAQMKVPLVQIRGQWVEADPTVLKEALDHWKRLKEKPGTLLDIMNSLREAGGGLEISSITGEGWLRDFFEAGDRGFEVLPPPAGLKAELRPYQQRGYSWLSFLARLGLGACLADDMGLGKTLQTLTFLLNEKAAGRLEKPVLLLCPTSVAGKWMKEPAKFTPDLRVPLRNGGARTRSTVVFRK